MMRIAVKVGTSADQRRSCSDQFLSSLLKNHRIYAPLSNVEISQIPIDLIIHCALSNENGKILVCTTKNRKKGF